MRPAIEAASLLFFAAVVVACLNAGTGGTPLPSPIPTSCGGSHSWPPNFSTGVAAPTGLQLTLVAPDRVRFTNGTPQQWTVAIGQWADEACLGWMESRTVGNSTAGDHVTVPPGGSIERTLDYAEDPAPHKATADLWDHSCPDSCADALAGFVWIDVPPAPPTPPAPIATGNTSEPGYEMARTDQFQLALTTDHHRYRAGESVNATAVLRYVGTAPDLLVTGSGSGPLRFLLTNVATGKTIGGLMTADCGPRHFHPGDVLTIPFLVSGVVEEWRAVGVDPPGPLTFVPGTWRIEAKPAFGIGSNCPADAALAVSVTVTVLP